MTSITFQEFSLHFKVVRKLQSGSFGEIFHI